MDITVLFKSAVKAIKLQLKQSGLAVPDEREDILKTRHSRCVYMSKYRDLVSQISQLRDFLLEHRKSYLNLSPSSEFTHSSDMSDFDRDKVDSEAQFIIKSCSQLISTYKKEVYLIDYENQELENRKAILDLIESYLKSVCKIYAEQKAIRVKLTVEIQKMSKLTNDTDLRLVSNSEKRSVEVETERDTMNEGLSTKYPRFAAGGDLAEDTALSEEELQMFEMENEQLYNDLNSFQNEVKEIQSKVIKIAELQEVFTEKVLEQSDEIERISGTLVGTTENLKDANVQIRQAIQSNASLRIYILFFLLIMSFSLLFLDWYND